MISRRRTSEQKEEDDQQPSVHGLTDHHFQKLMTLTRKDSYERDGDSFVASSNPYYPCSRAGSPVEEDQLVPSGREAEKMLESQTVPEMHLSQVEFHPRLDTVSELKRSNSVHVAGHGHVVLREKPKMSSRPRLSLCLNLSSTSDPSSSPNFCGSVMSVMSSESEDYDDDQESQRQLLCSSSHPMSGIQLRDSLSSVSMIHAEFWSVPFNHEANAVCGTGPKNRYRSILPNLQSRVVLPQVGSDLNSSYINANYIRGFHEQPKQYIATQGPLANTVYDFWRMVLMTQSPTIAMLTNLNEKNKSKCSSYFPDKGDITFGDITVVAIGSEQFDGYLVTELEVHQNEMKHKVCHFWYNSWPDHGIPKSPVPLLHMLEHVGVCRRSTPSAPVIVHCSAGIGRTGCFIGIDTGVQQLKKEGSVDLLRILCHIRQDRGGMVQTSEQYEFVHRALLLYEQELEKHQTDGSESLAPVFSEQ